MPIRLLSPEVASQIAAGEVIERPASVVKELVENALDAGAGHVRVSVEAAGRKRIEVADDGHGIPSNELALAVERHATSKVASAEDLFHIQTLGFRGEALASIGSVSRMTITSRPEGDEIAARIIVDGGHPGRLEQVGAPSGTVVSVENLFFNVPARLKFLKSDSTEHRQIDQLVARYALAYPRIRFHLWLEGRAAFQTSGNGDQREVLSVLYGVDVARQLLEVLAEEGNIRLTGFISPTSITRSTRKDIVFYVNGRPVQDPALSSALVQAYHTLLMVGRFPMAAIFIEMPPDAVDVNVHPTKAEVRFRESSQVFTAVQRSVRRALLTHAPVPGLEAPPGWPSYAQVETPGLWQRSAWESKVGAAPYPQPEVLDSQAAAPLQSIESRPPLLRLVGQIATAYLVAEGPDGLYLIDQHAAHERVLFEKWLRPLESQSGAPVPAQSLLQPVLVELSSSQARLLVDQLPILERVGFKVEPFGSSAYLVRAVPTLLAGVDPAAALRVLLEDFEEDETPLQAEVEARLIARICKRAAVKAGQTLSPEEQRALLRDLEACQSPRTCPHGRPTMIHLSVDVLERQFGRRGPR